MTTVKIISTSGITKTITETNSPNIKLLPNNRNTKLISLDYETKSIKEISPQAKIKQIGYATQITPVYPYRVRFTNVFIPGGVNRTSLPIGLAVIGFSNYIL
jgi:hypothetical protein